LGSATGVGTILDDDQPASSLAIANATIQEGNAGSTNVSVTVTMSPASTQQVTVNWATANGSATSGADYTTGSGTVTFAPSTTVQTILVPVLGDLLDEPDETFTITLSNPVNATVANGTSTVTIVDDDPTPTLSINDVPTTEGTGGSTTASFTVTLSAASGRTVTVNYATANGTATTPADYTAVSGTLTFAPGTTSAQVPVTIISDAVGEPNETFTVTLSGSVNATLADGSGLGTIVDDDAGGGPITLTLQIAAGADDVNDTTALNPSSASIWLGNETVAGSYTGLRFTNVAVPPGAIITSARLEVNASSTTWIGMEFEHAIEAAANSQPFTTTSRPSQRTLLGPRVTHISDEQWVASTWYALNEIGTIVQAAVNQVGWAAGNSMSVILRGGGLAWERKFVRAFEDDPTRAPRLIITYVAP
jgi:hypothetical protein